MTALERRVFLIGAALVGCGTFVLTVVSGWRAGLSFAGGGLLGGGGLLWLRRTVGGVFFHDPKGSKSRVITGFLLRLLLIPFCLYVMIRFLFLSVTASVAGFAAFYCSVLIEGILEAFGKAPE
jgi:hypothetical protein